MASTKSDTIGPTLFDAEPPPARVRKFPPADEPAVVTLRSGRPAVPPARLREASGPTLFDITKPRAAKRRGDTEPDSPSLEALEAAEPVARRAGHSDRPVSVDPIRQESLEVVPLTQMNARSLRRLALTSALIVLAAIGTTVGVRAWRDRNSASAHASDVTAPAEPTVAAPAAPPPPVATATATISPLPTTLPRSPAPVLTHAPTATAAPTTRAPEILWPQPVPSTLPSALPGALPSTLPSWPQRSLDDTTSPDSTSSPHGLDTPSTPRGAE